MVVNLKLVALAFAFVMFIGGMAILHARSKAGNAPWVNHAFGLVLLVPTVLILAVTDTLSKDMLAVLIGGIAGYIFGRSSREG